MMMSMKNDDSSTPSKLGATRNTNQHRVVQPHQPDGDNRENKQQQQQQQHHRYRDYLGLHKDDESTRMMKTVAHGLKDAYNAMTHRVPGHRVFGNLHVVVFEAQNLAIAGGTPGANSAPTKEQLMEASHEIQRGAPPVEKTVKLGNASPPAKTSHKDHISLKKVGAKRATCARTMITCMSCGCADGRADPFVSVRIVYPGRSSFILLDESFSVTNDADPKWDFESMRVVDFGGSDDPDAYLEIAVLDNDWISEGYKKNLGILKFSAKEIIERPDVASEWHKLRISSMLPHVGEVRVGIRYWPMLLQPEHPPQQQQQLTSSPPPPQQHRTRRDPIEVPHTYFPAEEGNMVRLFHDAASAHPHHTPLVPLGNGSSYSAESAWDCMHQAIDAAKHFVFIVGWSVNAEISLRRGMRPGEKHETLGNLLLRKSRDGVKIVLGLWDDFTSGAVLFKSGIMGTNDEYTKTFFAGSDVQVVLLSRQSTEKGKVRGLLAKATFTHHQKIVCVDHIPGGGDDNQQRVLAAFFGGLDLTNGRYDNGNHCLFTTLNTAHADDFYNACVPGVTPSTGPREPWHDIHAVVEGPAAWDLLQNFLERIAKQAPEMIKDTKAVVDRLLGDGLLAPKRHFALSPSHPAAWKTQIFRSIDSDSAIFDNKDFLGEFMSAELAVDQSIQQAYLYHINRAKRYIYIENQYFLGSSGFWRKEYEGVPSYHLVPWAIAQRIVRAISNKEQFAVYILLPLFPEGVPSTRAVQEILFWQRTTIQMIYSEVAEAIMTVGLAAHPADYVNFFFVGAREAGETTDIPPGVSPQLRKVLTARRHQIYVHSKMFIVDDEFVLLGSANINERSMSGVRDTEIAGGCWQPYFTVQADTHGAVRLPQGDVYGFRQSLWAEHFGQIYPEFSDPGSHECVQRVLDLAQRNWKAYSGGVPMDMPHGHMCRYPYSISRTGVVDSLPGAENIPDTDAPVVGRTSSLLLDVMTT